MLKSHLKVVSHANSALRTFWHRVRLAVKVLWSGLPEPNVDPDGALRQALAGHGPRGLPCPRCETRILVDIASLLTKGTVVCSKCHLELKIDWDDDERARLALERVQAAAEELERVKEFRR